MLCVYVTFEEFKAGVILNVFIELSNWMITEPIVSIHFYVTFSLMILSYVVPEVRGRTCWKGGSSVARLGAGMFY